MRTILTSTRHRRQRRCKCYNLLRNRILKCKLEYNIQAQKIFREKFTYRCLSELQPCFGFTARFTVTINHTKDRPLPVPRTAKTVRFLSTTATLQRYIAVQKSYVTKLAKTNRKKKIAEILAHRISEDDVFLISWSDAKTDLKPKGIVGGCENVRSGQ